MRACGRLRTQKCARRAWTFLTEGGGRADRPLPTMPCEGETGATPKAITVGHCSSWDGAGRCHAAQHRHGKLAEGATQAWCRVVLNV